MVSQRNVEWKILLCFFFYFHEFWTKNPFYIWIPEKSSEYCLNIYEASEEFESNPWLISSFMKIILKYWRNISHNNKQFSNVFFTSFSPSSYSPINLLLPFRKLQFPNHCFTIFTHLSNFASAHGKMLWQ